MLGPQYAPIGIHLGAVGRSLLGFPLLAKDTIMRTYWIESPGEEHRSAPRCEMSQYGGPSRCPRHRITHLPAVSTDNTETQPESSKISQDSPRQAPMIVSQIHIAAVTLDKTATRPARSGLRSTGT